MSNGHRSLRATRGGSVRWRRRTGFRDRGSIQYELDTGPCVDAVVQDLPFSTGDLLSDARWPKFYSTEPEARDEATEVIGTLMATHGGLAVAAAIARERADHLARALSNSREIGVAMGVLMTSHRITRTQAFDLLRTASQNSNRTLADLAAEVADTGVLHLPRAERRPRPGPPPPGLVPSRVDTATDRPDTASPRRP